MIDLNRVDTRKAALLMMHFQADVFSVLADNLPTDMLDRANALIRAWRSTGRPIIFAHFALGSHYESVNEKNRLISNISKTGLFREPTPVAGLEVAASDWHYACPWHSQQRSAVLNRCLG